MTTDQIKKILDHFGGREVNDKVIAEYCQLNKYEPITIGQYQDYLFQVEHDKRAAAATKEILEKLSQFQYVPFFISDTEKEKIKNANENIEWQICKVLEDNGVLYKEIDIITKNLGNAFQAILSSAGNRANNMCAIVLATLAKEKFGELLVLKTLGEYYRQLADKLAEKEKV